MKIDYPFPVSLSLKRVASVRAASIMLIRQLEISKFEVPQGDALLIPMLENDCWSVIHVGIRRSLENINLPDRVKNELLDTSRQLFSQIWDFLRYVTCILPYHEEDILSCICWGSNGVIQKRRTFQTLVESKAIKITVDGCELGCDTYSRLAYIWCLEDCVLNLMKEEGRNNVTVSSAREQLQEFWSNFSSHLYVRDISTRSTYEKFLRCSFKVTSSMAAQYFWNRITDEEKDLHVMVCTRFAICHKMSDFLCDILAHTNERQQKFVFENYYRDILELFLQWPYDAFILPCLKLAVEHFNFENFIYFLELFTVKLLIRPKGNDNWQRCLQTLWKEISAGQKELLFDNFDIYFFPFFEHLIQAGDISMIQLIVSDLATDHERLKYHLMRSKTAQRFLIGHKRDNNFSFIEDFLKVAFVSQCDITLFKAIVLEEWGIFLTV